MSDYTPDRWLVVKITTDKEPLYKVFACWYGGYLGSDSWRMSSGVTEVVEHDNHYEIHNHSGSVYTCYKNNIGMSSYTSRVFDNYLEKMKEMGATMEIVELKEKL